MKPHSSALVRHQEDIRPACQHRDYLHLPNNFVHLFPKQMQIAAFVCYVPWLLGV
jgi:hypothetical protein